MAEIEMPNLPGNSNGKKAEPPAPTPKTKAHVRDKTLGQKFGDAFLGEDAHNVRNYVWTDVVVPAVKQMIVDVVENAIEMIFGVNSRRSANERKNGYVAYSAYYQRDTRNDRRDDSAGNDPRIDCRNIIFESRGAAEEVLSELVDRTIDYGQASVAAFKELAGITGDFTDEKWGWTNLREAYVRRSGGGYIIVTPKPKPLNR